MTLGAARGRSEEDNWTRHKEKSWSGSDVVSGNSFICSGHGELFREGRSEWENGGERRARDRVQRKRGESEHDSTGSGEESERRKLHSQAEEDSAAGNDVGQRSTVRSQRCADGVERK